MPDADRTPSPDVRELVGRWHAAYAERVEAFVRGITRDAEISAEITQTVFAKAIERCPDALRTPDGDVPADEAEHSDARAWLYRVARNEAVSRLRRQGVERRALGKVDVPRPAAPLADPLVVGERVDALRAAVDSLNEKEQLLVRRHYTDGWTFARIAEETGEPLGTVLSRAHRTVGKLRTLLQGLDDD